MCVFFRVSLTIFGRGSAGFGAEETACSNAGSSELHQFLPPALSVHVGEQVGELGAGSQKFVEGSTLRATAAGEKSSMLSKVISTAILPFAGQRVGHLEGDARLGGLEPSSKLSTSISRHLRSPHRAGLPPVCRKGRPSRP